MKCGVTVNIREKMNSTNGRVRESINWFVSIENISVFGKRMNLPT